MVDDTLQKLEMELLKAKQMRAECIVNSTEYKKTVAKIEELYEKALLTSSKTVAAKLLVKIMKPYGEYRN
jgi:hypothetical protein